MENNIKNLDLREMIPPERHVKIFEMWDDLKVGETLRIINDHEPRPLYYQFLIEQEGLFEWKYEKEGPTQWIFLVKRIKEDKNE